MSRIAISLFLLLLFGACTKEETRVITGNTAAEDNSVDQLQIDSYINRLYIGLLGRKADDGEFTAARSLLNPDPHSVSARETLIASIQAQASWNENQVKRARLDLLEGVDSATMSRDYMLLLLQMQDTSLPVFILDRLETEKTRLEELILSGKEYMLGNINQIDLHRICVDNLYYDQINMGTENFVVSMFQHFLDRYPSGQELENGKTMVDGANSSIFLQTGSGKKEFLDIFFSSDAYYEGQVHRLFQEFLFRKATEDEVLNLAKSYALSHDFRELQKRILSSNEYFDQ